MQSHNTYIDTSCGSLGNTNIDTSCGSLGKTNKHILTLFSYLRLYSFFSASTAELIDGGLTEEECAMQCVTGKVDQTALSNPGMEIV